MNTAAVAEEAATSIIPVVTPPATLPTITFPVRAVAVAYDTDAASVAAVVEETEYDPPVMATVSDTYTVPPTFRGPAATVTPADVYSEFSHVAPVAEICREGGMSHSHVRAVGGWSTSHPS